MREDVEPRAGEVAPIQSVEECRLVHEAAPGDVDQVRSGLHVRELVAPDQAFRGRHQGRVQRHEIRLREKVAERTPVDPQGRRLGGADDGVGAEDLELEGARLRGQPTADPAETDDAERPAQQSVERPRGGAVVPPAGPERRSEGSQPARAREEKTERVVRDLLGAVVRHVNHDDAPTSRCADVGVVDARAVEPEHPAAGEPPDEGGVDRRVLDEEGVAGLGLPETRLGRERGAVDHVDPVRLQHRALRDRDPGTRA